MKIVDLGELPDRVLLFGGPYSNLQACQALFRQAKTWNIAAQNIICTGDVLAYCADPAATLSLIRAENITVVAGNCEKQLAANAMDCGCGFQAGTSCDILSRGWFAHASASVTTADRAWMADCPDLAVFSQAGQRSAVLHGGVTDIARFIWASSPVSVFEQEIHALTKAIGPVDAIIAGHCGMPFTRQIGALTWHNPGVIGMPPHDGHTETRFGILENGTMRIHKLSYDAQAARQGMEEQGLTQGYHRALTSGVWPSEDVLPDDLRRPDLLSDLHFA